jgi:hypothetical protein
MGCEVGKDKGWVRYRYVMNVRIWCVECESLDQQSPRDRATAVSNENDHSVIVDTFTAVSSFILLPSPQRLTS